MLNLSMFDILGDDPSTLEHLLARHPRIADEDKELALIRAALQPNLENLKHLLEYSDSSIIGVDAQFAGAAASPLAFLNAGEDIIEKWLRKGGDPRVKTLQNYSALLLAVRADNSKFVETLLNYPRVINHASARNRTLLHLSAWFGHLEVTRVLLEKGADPRLIDEDRQLPLHYACKKKHLDIAHRLVKSDPTTINHQDMHGRTPLVLAGLIEDSAIMRMLLENGAKLEICDYYGRMALYCAAEIGDAGLLELVLQSTDVSCVERWILNSSNLFNPNFSLQSITCYAISSGNVECVKLLVSSKLPKILLQMPYVEGKIHVYSPLAHVFYVYDFGDERLDASLQVLFEHKMTMIHDFFRQPSFNWLSDCKRLHHPFSFIIKSELPSSRKQYYLNLFGANNVTIDYCLQSYNDNSQPFASFNNYMYRRFYHPVWKAVFAKEMELIKLMISDSAILEPDQLIYHIIEVTPYEDWDSGVVSHSLPDLYPYLLSLKPIYFLKQQRRSPMRRDYSKFSLEEEFSMSTLQQLCRTVIRHHLRDYTLEDNLRNFRRKIMELPISASLKDYLLFKN